MINKGMPVIVKGNKTASMTMDEVAEVPIASWCDNTSEIQSAIPNRENISKD